jgi:pyridoxal phosphate enzyme (YggS family)
MNADSEIRHCVASIRERVRAAAEQSGRPADSVRLVAVSKTVPSSGIAAALAAGQHLFGENYIQEAKQKQAELSGRGDYEFHFIGSLQRNKAKDAVGSFSLIHSVDRPALARALSDCAQRRMQTQDILLQINVSGETTKSGVPAESAEGLARQIAALPHLGLRGLMCIGSYVDPSQPEEIRGREFRAMQQLRERLQQTLGLPLPELSMGMSHDFEIAIRHGATLVRVGSAIFGERRS